MYHRQVEEDNMLSNEEVSGLIQKQYYSFINSDKGKNYIESFGKIKDGASSSVGSSLTLQAVKNYKQLGYATADQAKKDWKNATAKAFIYNSIASSIDYGLNVYQKSGNDVNAFIGATATSMNELVVKPFTSNSVNDTRFAISNMSRLNKQGMAKAVSLDGSLIDTDITRKVDAGNSFTSWIANSAKNLGVFKIAADAVTDGFHIGKSFKATAMIENFNNAPKEEQMVSSLAGRLSATTASYVLPIIENYTVGKKLGTFGIIGHNAGKSIYQDMTMATGTAEQYTVETLANGAVLDLVTSYIGMAFGDIAAKAITANIGPKMLASVIKGNAGALFGAAGANVINQIASTGFDMVVDYAGYKAGRSLGMDFNQSFDDMFDLTAILEKERTLAKEEGREPNSNFSTLLPVLGQAFGMRMATSIAGRKTSDFMNRKILKTHGNQVYSKAWFEDMEKAGIFADAERNSRFMYGLGKFVTYTSANIDAGLIRSVDNYLKANGITAPETPYGIVSLIKNNDNKVNTKLVNYLMLSNELATNMALRSMSAPGETLSRMVLGLNHKVYQAYKDVFSGYNAYGVIKSSADIDELSVEKSKLEEVMNRANNYIGAAKTASDVTTRTRDVIAVYNSLKQNDNFSDDDKHLVKAQLNSVITAAKDKLGTLLATNPSEIKTYADQFSDIDSISKSEIVRGASGFLGSSLLADDTQNRTAAVTLKTAQNIKETISTLNRTIEDVRASVSRSRSLDGSLLSGLFSNNSVTTGGNLYKVGLNLVGLNESTMNRMLNEVDKVLDVLSRDKSLDYAKYESFMEMNRQIDFAVSSLIKHKIDSIHKLISMDPKQSGISKDVVGRMAASQMMDYMHLKFMYSDRMKGSQFNFKSNEATIIKESELYKNTIISELKNLTPYQFLKRHLNNVEDFFSYYNDEMTAATTLKGIMFRDAEISDNYYTTRGVNAKGYTQFAIANAVSGMPIHDSNNEYNKFVLISSDNPNETKETVNINPARTNIFASILMSGKLASQESNEDHTRSLLKAKGLGERIVATMVRHALDKVYVRKLSNNSNLLEADAAKEAAVEVNKILASIAGNKFKVTSYDIKDGSITLKVDPDMMPDQLHAVVQSLSLKNMQLSQAVKANRTNGQSYRTKLLELNNDITLNKLFTIEGKNVRPSDIIEDANRSIGFMSHLRNIVASADNLTDAIKSIKEAMAYDANLSKFRSDNVIKVLIKEEMKKIAFETTLVGSGLKNIDIQTAFNKVESILSGDGFYYASVSYGTDDPEAIKTIESKFNKLGFRKLVVGGSQGESTAWISIPRYDGMSDIDYSKQVIKVAKQLTASKLKALLGPDINIDNVDTVAKLDALVNNTSNGINRLRGDDSLDLTRSDEWANVVKASFAYQTMKAIIDLEENNKIATVDNVISKLTDIYKSDSEFTTLNAQAQADYVALNKKGIADLVNEQSNMLSPLHGSKPALDIANDLNAALFNANDFLTKGKSSLIRKTYSPSAFNTFNTAARNIINDAAVEFENEYNTLIPLIKSAIASDTTAPVALKQEALSLSLLSHTLVDDVRNASNDKVLEKVNQLLNSWVNIANSYSHIITEPEAFVRAGNALWKIAESFNTRQITSSTTSRSDVLVTIGDIMTRLSNSKDGDYSVEDTAALRQFKTEIDKLEANQSNEYKTLARIINAVNTNRFENISIEDALLIRSTTDQRLADSGLSVDEITSLRKFTEYAGKASADFGNNSATAWKAYTDLLSKSKSPFFNEIANVEALTKSRSINDEKQAFISKKLENFQKFKTFTGKDKDEQISGLLSNIAMDGLLIDNFNYKITKRTGAEFLDQVNSADTIDYISDRLSTFSKQHNGKHKNGITVRIVDVSKLGGEGPEQFDGQMAMSRAMYNEIFAPFLGGNVDNSSKISFKFGGQLIKVNIIEGDEFNSPSMKVDPNTLYIPVSNIKHMPPVFANLFNVSVAHIDPTEARASAGVFIPAKLNNQFNPVFKAFIQGIVLHQVIEQDVINTKASQQILISPLSSLMNTVFYKNNLKPSIEKAISDLSKSIDSGQKISMSMIMNKIKATARRANEGVGYYATLACLTDSGIARRHAAGISVDMFHDQSTAGIMAKDNPSRFDAKTSVNIASLASEILALDRKGNLDKIGTRDEILKLRALARLLYNKHKESKHAFAGNTVTDKNHNTYTLKDAAELFLNALSHESIGLVSKDSNGTGNVPVYSRIWNRSSNDGQLHYFPVPIAEVRDTGDSIAVFMSTKEAYWQSADFDGDTAQGLPFKSNGYRKMVSDGLELMGEHVNPEDFKNNFVYYAALYANKLSEYESAVFGGSKNEVPGAKDAELLEYGSAMLGGGIIKAATMIHEARAFTHMTLMDKDGVEVIRPQMPVNPTIPETSDNYKVTTKRASKIKIQSAWNNRVVLLNSDDNLFNTKNISYGMTFVKKANGVLSNGKMSDFGITLVKSDNDKYAVLITRETGESLFTDVVGIHKFNSEREAQQSFKELAQESALFDALSDPIGRVTSTVNRYGYTHPENLKLSASMAVFKRLSSDFVDNPGKAFAKFFKDKGFNLEEVASKFDELYVKMDVFAGVKMFDFDVTASGKVVSYTREDIADFDKTFSDIYSTNILDRTVTSDENKKRLKEGVRQSTLEAVYAYIDKVNQNKYVLKNLDKFLTSKTSDVDVSMFDDMLTTALKHNFDLAPENLKIYKELKSITSEGKYGSLTKFGIGLDSSRFDEASETMLRKAFDMEKVNYMLDPVYHTFATNVSKIDEVIGNIYETAVFVNSGFSIKHIMSFAKEPAYVGRTGSYDMLVGAISDDLIKRTGEINVYDNAVVDKIMKGLNITISNLNSAQVSLAGRLSTDPLAKENLHPGELVRSKDRYVIQSTKTSSPVTSQELYSNMVKVMSTLTTNAEKKVAREVFSSFGKMLDPQTAANLRAINNGVTSEIVDKIREITTVESEGTGYKIKLGDEGVFDMLKNEKIFPAINNDNKIFLDSFIELNKNKTC